MHENGKPMTFEYMGCIRLEKDKRIIELRSIDGLSELKSTDKALDRRPEYLTYVLILLNHNMFLF